MYAVIMVKCADNCINDCRRELLDAAVAKVEVVVSGENSRIADSATSKQRARSGSSFQSVTSRHETQSCLVHRHRQ